MFLDLLGVIMSQDEGDNNDFLEVKRKGSKEKCENIQNVEQEVKTKKTRKKQVKLKNKRSSAY